MPKQKCYISGPMTGYPNENFPAFHDAEGHVWKLGYSPINPARNFGGATDLAYSTYMERDLQQVLEADAIYMLKGWQNSNGARIELSCARALDMEVHFQDGACDNDPVETEAQGLVRNGARQHVYGHPAEDFKRTAQIWAALLGVEVTAQQVAMCMIGLKMSRLTNSPDHRDSVVDLIGYGICIDRVNSYEQGKNA